MNHHIKFYGLALVIVAALLSPSCKKKAGQTSDIDSGTYFSIHQFAVDEWNTFEGEPITILKTLRIDDKTVDSSYTNTDSFDWTPIFKTFFATDISDRKFLGKYKYSHFPDNEDETVNLFWEANEDEDDLFTRKLLIAADLYTHKVTGIYIETFKKSFGKEVTQKLYYKPMKEIQIQTDERPWFGKKKFTVLQYDFMR